MLSKRRRHKWRSDTVGHATGGSPPTAHRCGWTRVGLRLVAARSRSRGITKCGPNLAGGYFRTTCKEPAARRVAGQSTPRKSTPRVISGGGESGRGPLPEKGSPMSNTQSLYYIEDTDIHVRTALTRWSRIESAMQSHSYSNDAKKLGYTRRHAGSCRGSCLGLSAAARGITCRVSRLEGGTKSKRKRWVGA